MSFSNVVLFTWASMVTIASIWSWIDLKRNP